MVKIKKRYPLGINCLLLFSLIVVLSSCFSPYAEDEATVTIDLGSGTAGRMSYGPGVSGYPYVSDLRFEVVFTPTGSSGTRKTITADGPRTDRIRGIVAPGEYRVTVEVFLLADQSLYASGQAVDSAGVLLDFVSITMGSNLITVRMNMDPDVRGLGTPEKPFKVYDETSMKMVGRGEAGTQYAGWTLSAHYILIRDIPLTGEWTRIPGVFTGTFDGNRKTISGLTITSATAVQQGLFQGNSGTIKNLGLVGVNININESAVGGIAGGNTGSGRVENCYVIGSISGSSNIGGIVGNNQSIVENCYFTGSVNGTSSIGGIAGNNQPGGRLVNCYSTGNVSGSGTIIGGIAGANQNIVENCYSTSSVSGVGAVGGIAGNNLQVTYTVENCVALNDTITDTLDGIVNTFGRVVGGIISGSTLQNNHGRDGMQFIRNTTPQATFPDLDDTVTGKDGADVTTTQAGNRTWWESPAGPGWTIHANRVQASEASPWYWGGGRPRLWFE